MVSGGVRTEAWLLSGTLLLLVGAMSRSLPIAVLGLLLLTVVLTARLWAHFSLHGVRYERHLSSERVYAGESVQMEATLTNRKLLALPWLVIEDRFDPLLVVRGLDTPDRIGKLYELRRQVSVSWYQRVRFSYRVECPRRGYHVIGPARLRSGDPFGLYERDRLLAKTTGLLVYPKLARVEGLRIDRLFPFDSVRTGRGLLDDPMNVTGVRPYAEGDTLRQVHWRASARSTGLQSKVWRPTTEPGVVIFLDLASAEHAWQGVDVEAVEKAISTAGTVIHQVHGARRALGLYVNGLRSGTNQKIRIGLAKGEQAFEAAMETLARVYPYPNMALAELMRSERHSLPVGATVVVVTAVRLPAVDEQVEVYRRGGRHVLVLDVGRPTPATAPVLEQAR